MSSLSPLRGVFAKSDAWLPTGDLFRRDGDGDFWLVDHVTGMARTAGGPVPTLSSAPVESGDPQPHRSDAQLAFDLLSLRSDGTSLTLKWNDPTDVEGVFALSEVSPRKLPVWDFEAGTTQGTLPFVVKPGQHTCFVMTVHLPTGEVGLSVTRCVTG